jgi:pyoverdine/dityrosine biosynthesis protein
MIIPSRDEDLCARAIAAVRAHWTTPRASEDLGPLPAALADRLARAALEAMLTRPFRVGVLPVPEIYDKLLRRVRRSVDRGRPIRISLGFGPMKNPNGAAVSRADWAEFFALCHLIAWHNKVQAVYSPGLTIRIVFDDATLIMANRADRGQIASYIASIRALIGALGFERVLLPPMRQSSFAWLFHLGIYPLARWRVRRWERDPAHFDQIEQMAQAARRNLVLPRALDQKQQDRRVTRAAHRYRVYWEALQLSHLSLGRRRLVAMYLDGSQHHIRQPVAFHLTTLDKGQITQPWQGEGSLRDNGHGRLEPYVLTTGRRERSVVRTVSGLDLIRLPGFDRIAVTWSQVPSPTEFDDRPSEAISEGSRRAGRERALEVPRAPSLAEG